MPGNGESDRYARPVIQNPPPPPTERPRRGVRRWPKVLLTLVVAFAAVGCAAAGYYQWCRGASGPKDPLTVSVPHGVSGTDVVSRLKDRGVVRCGLVSKLVVRIRDVSFQAGAYRLTTNMTLDDALDALEAGPVGPPTVQLTIPEGFRVTQIADRVSSTLGLPASEFVDRATSGDYSLPPYLPKGTSTVEGFLYPNTYEFVKDKTSADDVIRELLDEFGKEAKTLPWPNAERLGVTPYEVVTIASMIEEEAKVPQDRTKIAAVIYNRLKIGMSLGIDATIRYIDPDPSNGLTESDLHIDSPYNTRDNPGLPPTPIASPGRPSLLAALEPADVDYLYYVLCGTDGHHEFTASYDEFLRLKSRCLG